MTRALLLLRGGLSAGFSTLEVSGPTFAFDVLVQLLAHGGWRIEGSMFQRVEDESSIRPRG